MKRILPILFCSLTSMLFSMEKNLKWDFSDPRSKKNISLGEKGSIQEAFIREGLLPDPHVGMNEKLFDWIEDHQWTLKSSFTIQKNELTGQIIDIDLPSVDTYAEIYLNGQLILTCDNAFIPYRLTINQWLKEGKNELVAVFTPPVLYFKDSYEKAAYKLPAANDPHKIAIAPYSRKPQYQFGWDWTFRMNTIGFNKVAKIVSYKSNQIINKNIQTIELIGADATLSFGVHFAQTPLKNYHWKSELFGELTAHISENWLTTKVELKNAQLWWPIHFGNQHLYTDKWTITDENGSIIDQKTVQFGVRKSELIQEKDQFGTSYEIAVNGKKIFCKGGDYIPQEVFPARVTDDMVRDMIQQMKAANFNMVRVWGGGYYPDDVFFDECDKLGIMVWQDYMFACSMYPGTPEFLANVKREFDYQTPRISSHPSVVLLNGNNEVDVAWKNWGFQVKYNLYGKAAKEIEQAYDDLFKQLLPERISVYSTVPYIHTSPLSNWGKPEYYNHGSQHYWGVWHGKDPLEDFGNKSGRFNAEYGFQSFPEYATLTKVLDKKDWNLETEAMKLRQKSYVGNGMIKKHSDNLFGKTTDFEEFIYFSQLTQARAVGIAIASHRTDWPRCAGTLFWQVNDCWPAPTWSSIDYYGNWKALHYQAQKDYENIAVLPVESKLNKKEFFLVSDACETYQNDVCFDFYDLNGNWLEQHAFFVETKPQTVVSLPVFSLIQKPLNEYIVRMSWKDEKGLDKERIIYNTNNNQRSKSNKDFQLEIIEKNNHQVLILTNKEPLFDCWIYSEQHFFHLDKNFETLLPGRHEFIISSKEKLTISELKIRYSN